MNSDFQDAVLVITKQIEKFPYCPEYADSMPKTYRSYYSSTPEDRIAPGDWEFTDPFEAVKKFYQDKESPFPIHSFDELIGQVLTDTEGNKRLIDCEEAYFHYYGMELCDLYWVRFQNVCAAVCRDQDEAEIFIRSHAKKLIEPAIRRVKHGAFLEIA